MGTFQKSTALALLLVPILLGLGHAGEPKLSLRITNPAEAERYYPTSQASVLGLVQMPNERFDASGMFIRVRWYWPGNGAFIIENERVAELKQPEAGKKQIPFEITIKAPAKEGPYLLKVDLIRYGMEKYPKNLVATQSLFLEVGR